ncbi:hypothetical protein AVEN_60039-1 [Araneus ventricosus]|uniref:Uncharacterized protein n=1 Tax=Araneus ventricosus TaxID=182803 RepID=A0A4Y2CBM9_ARAVE|nr:hypothetical protein AVEN_60039-1 [Araneus ventricosus]
MVGVELPPSADITYLLWEVRDDSRRISKRELAFWMYNNGGGQVTSFTEITYLLREGSSRGRCWLLKLRAQYYSYCSDCHSKIPECYDRIGVTRFTVML